MPPTQTSPVSDGASPCRNTESAETHLGVAFHVDSLVGRFLRRRGRSEGLSGSPSESDCVGVDDSSGDEDIFCVTPASHFESQFDSGTDCGDYCRYDGVGNVADDNDDACCVRESCLVNAVATAGGECDVQERDELPIDCGHLQCVVDLLPGNLSRQERQQILDLLYRYRDTFAKSELDIGLTNLMEFSIPLINENGKPHFEPLRSHPMAYLPIIDQEVERLLAADVIEPANSCWNANVVLVMREGKSPRMAIDHRGLNLASVKQKPVNMLRIPDILDGLSGASYFSKLDVQSAYNQIGIREEDRFKTPFCTRQGQFR